MNLLDVIKWGVVAVVIITVAIVLGTAADAVHRTILLTSPGVAQSDAQRLQAENQARTAEIQRQEAQAAYWNPRIEAAKGVAIIGLLYALPTALILAFAAIVSLAVKHSRMPPADGRPPAIKWNNDRQWESWLMFQNRLTDAVNKQGVPAHYAPSTTYAPRIEMLGTPASNSSIPEPSLAQILQSTELCFGIEEGGGLVSIGGEMKSGAIGGKPGFGKTNTVALLAAQTVLRGGTVRTGDPHYGASRAIGLYLGESMGSAVNTVGPDPSDILNMVQEVYDIWKDRQLQAATGNSEFPPLMLVLDEWTELLKGEARKFLPRLLGDIIRGGPKYGVVSILVSQRWSAGATGGTELRNLTGWQLAHNMRKEDGRMLSGMGADSPDTGSLVTGEAILFGHPDGTKHIRVPSVVPDALPTLTDGTQNISSLPESSESSEEPSNRAWSDIVIPPKPTSPTCPRCGSSFEPKRADQKYCSTNCRKRASEGK